jgi:hypothetical protein
MDADKAKGEETREEQLQPGKVEKQQLENTSDLVKQTGQKLSTARSVDDYRKGWPADPAQQKQLTDQGFVPPDQVKNARDVMTATQRASQLATTPKERADIEHGKNEEAISRGNLAVSQANSARSEREYQQKYGDVLGSLGPANAKLAESIANGDTNPTAISRPPNKEQILNGAITLNPNYATAYTTKQSFANPQEKQSQNLSTIARIVGHIDRFEKNSKDMGTAPLYAMGVNQTGGQAALNNDAHAISAELEKLTSGVVGSVEQVKEWQKGLHSVSADARQKSVDEISQLIGSQYEGMNQAYKAGTGQPLPVERFVSPAGQQWMRAKGINVEGMPAGQSQPSAGPPLTPSAPPTTKAAATVPTSR